MSSGYIYLIIAGVIAAGAGVFIVMLRMARKSAYAEGKAEAERAAIEAAKETEEAMEEITSQPRDPEKTKRELEGGTF